MTSYYLYFYSFSLCLHKLLSHFFLQANPNVNVFKKKGLVGYDKPSKIFKNSMAMAVFTRASNQGPLNIDEEIYVGGGPIAFAMDNANVRGSGANSRP